MMKKIQLLIKQLKYIVLNNMKKSTIIIAIIGAFIFGFVIGHMIINTYYLTKSYKSRIEKSTPTTIQSNTKCSFLANDAVPFTIQYSWVLENSYDEFDKVQINLIIDKTIKKFFAKYSSEEIYNQRDSIMYDLMDRINDYVFVLYPTNFNLIKLALIPEI